MLKKFGNSFFWIQHVQIRLEHISKHFYQKMPSQVTFSEFPASLAQVSKYINSSSINSLKNKKQCCRPIIVKYYTVRVYCSMSGLVVTGRG